MHVLQRDARYTDHGDKELLSQRIFQMACGYEDANDCNTLGHDPAFKAACGRLPLSDAPLGAWALDRHDARGTPWFRR